MKNLTSVLVAVGVAGGVLFPSYAAQHRDNAALRRMADCAKVQPLAERLPCYNDLSIGTWHMMVSSRGGVYMSTLSVADHPEVYVRPKLLLACDEKAVLVFINWRDELRRALAGTTEPPRIKMSLDGGSFESLPWEFAERHLISYLRGEAPDGNAPRVRFIERLLRARTLTVRAEPSGKPAVVAIYKLQSLDKAIEPLKLACGLN